jgi:hypothetical protein
MDLLKYDSENKANNEIYIINEHILIMLLLNINQNFDDMKILIPYLNEGIFTKIISLKFNKNDANINFNENKFKYFVTINECFKQFVIKIFTEEKMFQNLIEGVIKYVWANVEDENNEIYIEDFLELCSEYAKENEKLFEKALLNVFDIVEIESNKNRTVEKEKDKDKLNSTKKVKYAFRLKPMFEKSIQNIKNELKNPENKEKEKEKEKNKNNNIRNRNIRQSNKIIRTNKTYVNTNSIMEANHKKTFSLNNLLANDIIKDEAKKGKYHKVGTHENHGKPKVKLNKYNLEKLLSKDGPEDKLTINIKKTSSKKNNQNRISKIVNSASNKNLSISKQQSMTSQHLKSKNSKNEIKKKLIYNYTTSNLMQKPKMNNHHIHINKRNHNINGSHLTNSRSITFLNSNNNKNNQPLGGLGTYIIYSNPNPKKKNNLKNKFTNQRNHVINLNNHYNLSYTDLSNRNYKYRHPKKIALNLSNLNEANSFENEENSNSFKAKKFIQKVNTMLDKDQLKNSIPHRVSYSTKNYSTDRRSPKKSLHLNKINSPALTNSETRKKHYRRN